MTASADKTVSSLPCDDGGQCAPTCQCTEKGVQCDCACSDDADVCDHQQAQAAKQHNQD